MNRLNPFASQSIMADLRGTADIIDEVSDNLVYFGFCKAGTGATSELSWSIMRVEISATAPPATTIYKWANGLCCFNLSWDNRADYEYKFKNF